MIPDGLVSVARSFRHARLRGIVFVLLIPLAARAVEPLRLHPDNPHYLLFRGKPTIPITSGEHYGAALNLDFDFIPYLDELHAKGLNHTRTFSGTYREVPESFGITDNPLAPKPNRYLCPWARSSTPGYFDGGNKFDLARWDEAYFRRLQDFVGQACRRGIIVEMNLFCPLYHEPLWQANPMNARNNVNGIGKCRREEVYTLRHKDLTDVQKAVTRRILEALKDFDNVYHEICNEPWVGGVTMEWQNEIISTIVDTEASFPYKHLISLNLSRVEITNPNPAVSIFNFHNAAPPDVVAMNYGLNRVIGDNETGFRGRENFPYRTEAWDFIIAGGGLLSSLDYSFTPGHSDGSFEGYTSPGGGNAVLRNELRILKEFIHGFDFIRMVPDNSVIKGGIPAGTVSARALVDKGRAYAIYARVRTDADTFSACWTGFVTPAFDETYIFHTITNDGVRLWVNDRLLIDNSRDHKTVEDKKEIALRTGQRAALRMECYQSKGRSVAQLLWSSPSQAREIIPQSRLTPPDGKGEGLRGEYFEDRKLKKSLMTRVEPVIDFHWSKDGPFGTNLHPIAMDLEVELPAGAYKAEWIDPKTGVIADADSFDHAGGNRRLRSPRFTEDVTLRVLGRK